MNFVSTSPFEVSASTFMGGFSGEPVAAMVEFDLRPLKPGRDYAGVNYIAEEPLHVDGEAIREEYGGRMSGNLRLDPLLFFKPAHPAFQARFRQTACSASHSNLWFTSPHTMSLMRSYVFSGFRYLSPMIRHVLTLRIACST